MRHCTFLRHVGSRSSSMKRKAALGAAALACGATVCAAAAEETVTTRLIGYQETRQTAVDADSRIATGRSVSRQPRPGDATTFPDL